MTEEDPELIQYNEKWNADYLKGIHTFLKSANESKNGLLTVFLDEPGLTLKTQGSDSINIGLEKVDGFLLDVVTIITNLKLDNFVNIIIIGTPSYIDTQQDKVVMIKDIVDKYQSQIIGKSPVLNMKLETTNGSNL